ncbi:MAG: response regulator [Candidatus Omnitrophica bacterium]|nr:response regulator [Candidatus Omnitrophota bacterium]
MWKILVVDDNQNNCDLICEILAGIAECDVAMNGKKALEIYKASLGAVRKYDMILLDIAMPEMDGIEVLNRIRSDEERKGVGVGKGISIIMVTAYREPFLDAFNGGCDDYIVKPVFPDELIRKIRNKLS